MGMCKEHCKSREKLSELIFKLKNFTLEELMKEFTRIRHGRIEIGESQTVEAFLDDLREFGVLGLEFKRYSVQKRS